MRYITLIFCLLAFKFQMNGQTAEEQSTQEFIADATDKFSTDGSGKSNGLKLHLKYPKSWSALDGERPHIVKKFLQPGGDALFLIMVQSQDSNFTQIEIDELFTAEGLKYAMPTGATFISSNSKLKIESLKAGSIEYTTINTRGELTLYGHCLNYLFVYKQHLITLQCFVSSTTGESTQAIDKKFYTLKPLFSMVFNSLVLDNVWTD